MDAAGEDLVQIFKMIKHKKHNRGLWGLWWTLRKRLDHMTTSTSLSSASGVWRSPKSRSSGENHGLWITVSTRLLFISIYSHVQIVRCLKWNTNQRSAMQQHVTTTYSCRNVSRHVIALRDLSCGSGTATAFCSSSRWICQAKSNLEHLGTISFHILPYPSIVLHLPSTFLPCQVCNGQVSFLLSFLFSYRLTIQVWKSTALAVQGHQLWAVLSHQSLIPQELPYGSCDRLLEGLQGDDVRKKKRHI